MVISKNSSIHEQVLVSLRKIMRAIDIYSRKLAKDHKLTGPQLAILKEIQNSGGLSIGRLAVKVSLSNATVTGILDRLEKRHLIKRIRDTNDRRKIIVEITDEAKEMLKKAPPPLQDHFILFFDKMPDDEQKQILNSLEKVASIMGAENLDAAPILLSHPVPMSETAINKELAEPKDSRPTETGVGRVMDLD